MPQNRYGQDTTDMGHVLTEHEKVAAKIRDFYLRKER